MALLLFFLKNNYSQNVYYKIIKDDPKDVVNFSCNLDFFHLDCGFSQIDGSSINLGAWGHAMYKNMGGIDYSFRYGYLTFGKFSSDGKGLGNNLFLQPGVFYIFHKREKNARERLILESYSETYGNKTYIHSKFITVDNHIYKYKALRGGLYFKRGMANFLKESWLSSEGYLTNYVMLGMYGGICFGTTENVVAQTDNYGECGTTLHVRYCFDAFFIPVNNISFTSYSFNPFGGRFLMQILPAVTRKEKRKHGYSGIGRLAYELEIGYRPVDGIYLATTITIPIAKRLKVLGNTSNEPQRTSE